MHDARFRSVHQLVSFMHMLLLSGSVPGMFQCMWGVMCFNKYGMM
jgi:hypothetical protein